MKTTNTVIFETGATSHSVNDLILFAENTRELVEIADGIYSAWRLFGDNCIARERFVNLYLNAVKMYNKEFGKENSNHINTIDRKGMREFCQLYANDFDNWKFEHGYK